MEYIEWKEYRLSRLMLGTVQLGMEYGISNTVGKPDLKQAFEILDTAWKHNVNVLDTAMAYGDSETVIGQYIQKHNADFQIITKLSPTFKESELSDVADLIEASVNRLHKPLLGLLLHKPAHLNLWSKGLREVLNKCKKAGLVKHLGVSVYTPEEYNKAVKLPDIDIIQFPLNVFDQRFITEKRLKAALDNDMLLCCRSVYLQGLLLLEPHQIEDSFSFIKPDIEKWYNHIRMWDIKPAELALRFAKTIASRMVLLTGCETVDQLIENIRIFEKSPLPEYQMNILATLRLNNEKKINPSLWPNK